MIWPFDNYLTDKILERAAEPVWKVEPPRAWPDPPAVRGMSRQAVNELAQYNAERARGIMHTPEWVSRMAILQGRWDKQVAEEIL